MSEKRKACTIDGKRVKPCWALDETVGGTAFDNHKGVVVWTLMNEETGGRALTLYGVRSGKYAKNGLVFNFCPFCGNPVNNSGAEAQIASQQGKATDNG